MTANRTQGETEGPEQEPTEAGDQDPAKRAPRPDGPMNQPVDPAEASDAFGQREGQADTETGGQPS